MRTFYLFLILCLGFSITSTAQSRNITPSDNITTKVYDDFSGFTSLDLANDLKAYVTFTDGPESIKIEANENLHKYITVDMDGSTLVIKFNGSWNMKGDATLHAYISTRQLRNFRASADAYIFLENTLETEKAKITLRGDSQLKGNVAVKDLYLNLRGDSIIDIDGSADEVEAELRGDSVMEDGGFKTKDAKITLRGDSVAEIEVTNKLWADLDGDSILKYAGSPEIMKSRVTGDSEMKRSN